MSPAHSTAVGCVGRISMVCHNGTDLHNYLCYNLARDSTAVAVRVAAVVVVAAGNNSLVLMDDAWADRNRQDNLQL